MLMILKRYDEAVQAYRTVLARSPRRLNSLSGAGRALDSSGDPTAARFYFDEIAAMAGKSSQRPTIVRARTLTAQGNLLIPGLQR